MDKEKIDLLFERYLDGECTEEERQLLELWFAGQSAKGDWKWRDGADKEATADRIRSYLNQLYLEPAPKRPTHRVLVKAAAIAASFLLLASLTFWFYHEKGQAVSNKLSRQASLDSLAANEGEVSLLLADGSLLYMDHIESGDPYELGKKTLEKVAADELILGNSKKNASSPVPSLASLIVPKGKTFKLTLDDGTRVWVNTASTITFPSDMGENERQVILENGEAYFEVAKDKNRPFTLRAGNASIQVLGTKFNVHAYKEEEKVVTTLIEGSVKLSNATRTTMLKPNQQAINYNKSNELTKKEVDVDHVLAWQKGYFVFDDQDIRSIMNDVSRWYDVEVSYQGAVSQKKFGGTFSKSKNVAELLSYLESISGNLRFKQIGRRIIVMS